MFSRTFTTSIFILQLHNLIGDPLVQLPNGKIRGREAKTFENKSYYSFRGIPYAAPPVGKLRFKPPQHVDNWDGVLNTTDFRRICFQTSYNSDNESEDCLYINVFTPELPSKHKNVSLPVMLYIHGGGFIDGSGVSTEPDLFIDNDVVLAAINYRIGIFGFISTQDEAIPGNNGLKDQRFAIQWVHDNIHLFGGDPEKITIFGQSAGSASCAYQLLNEDSKGLFQSAILQSGSFLSPWAFQRRAREIAFTTASFLNSSFKNSNDSQALLNYFLTVDARDLDSAAGRYDKHESPEDLQISQGFYWAPVVEVENSNAFLTKKMYGLLQAGQVIRVPILIGITSEENLAFNRDAKRLRTKMAAYDVNLDWVVPNDMLISDKTKRTEIGRLIRDLYTNGKPWVDHLGDGVRYSSDTSFTRSVIKHAELYSKISETYFYIFSYDGKMGGGTTYYDGAERVGHSEENQYLFCSDNGCDGRQFPESDMITRQRLIKLWTDFAKYKNPTPKPSALLQNVTWPLLCTDSGDFYYLDVGENLEIKNHPKENTYNGWNKLYSSLSYNDFDTY